jgi:adenosine deaminase
MSVQSFVQAMPKVELHVHLEGAIQKERLLVIAEQNEIAEQVKHFNDWVRLLDKPDYERLYETVETTIQWLKHPEDLTHAAYELGVSLARQNIRYAEVSVNPVYFTENGWTFEQFLGALNDGRGRAERGWNVQMRWILMMGRNQPRHADDIVRWASSSGGLAGGIVGIGLGGPENAQPAGQFERAFKTAVKKHIARYVHAGEKRGAEGVLEVLKELEPTHLLDGWGAADSAEVRQMLIDQHIPLDICLKRAICHGWVSDYSQYPLRKLYDDGVPIILGTDMPWFYKTTLSDEYLAVVQHIGMGIEELEQIALNAIAASQMSDTEKSSMAASFRQEYAQLREEHLNEEDA